MTLSFQVLSRRASRHVFASRLVTRGAATRDSAHHLPAWQKPRFSSSLATRVSDDTNASNSNAPFVYERPAPAPGKNLGTEASNFDQEPWQYRWVSHEAELITARAYRRHKALGDTNPSRPKPPTKEQLESLGEDINYPAVKTSDYVARGLVRMLIPFTHLFFREKYNHHAVVLETVAAVPGMVGGFFRHLRSLRLMQRDYGWVWPLLEEAENERMHLLIWLQVCRPTYLERLLVMLAQAVYTGAYSLMYLFHPGMAHRFVGYLEEEAVRAYTLYLKAVDDGHLPNGPAPDIAKKYYALPEDATIRDVILFVRADETLHRSFNHMLSEMHRTGRTSSPPNYPPKVPDLEWEKESQ
jgi:ubiquinol oxidase